MCVKKSILIEDGVIPRTIHAYTPNSQSLLQTKTTLLQDVVKAGKLTTAKHTRCIPKSKLHKKVNNSNIFFLRNSFTFKRCDELYIVNSQETRMNMTILNPFNTKKSTYVRHVHKYKRTNSIREDKRNEYKRTATLINVEFLINPFLLPSRYNRGRSQLPRNNHKKLNFTIYY